jgi:DNA-binding transcriptional LysR family regulator
MEVHSGEMRVFVTLADERHFGRTAERLHLTPSRVSQIVRGLESRLGGRLFDRTSRSVSLTPLGQRLLDRVRPAWEELEQGLEQARREAGGVTGILRIGMHLRVNGGPRLGEIIRAFEERYPTCRVDCLDIDPSRPELHFLRQGDADLLAIRLPVSDTEARIGPVLSCDARAVAVASHHPLAGKESVSLDELAGDRVCFIPGMRAELLDDLLPPRTPAGHALRRTAVRSTGEALTRTALGETVYLAANAVFDYVSHPGVVVVPVRGLPPSRTALAWLASSRAPAPAAFTEVASEILRTSDGRLATVDTRF